jgi:Zn-dependent protease with chaperone function
MHGSNASPPESPGPAAAPATLAADYFDGQSARAHAVRLSRRGAHLHIQGEAIELDIAARDVRWSERTRHGPRIGHLAGGGALHCRDAQACDAWLRAAGQGESVVVRAQQSWRWVLASTVALVAVLAALWIWGVPGASRLLLLAVPPSVDKALGETTLGTLDQHLTAPSALDPASQQRIRESFARAVQAQAARSGAPRTVPAATPAHELVFRRARDKTGIGPNAFALPGGTIVMTDALVELLDAEPDVLNGVLAHELGHVHHRHGMRMVVQASLVGLLSSVVLGDFSSVLAAAPVLLGQASYSRDSEREADAYCAEFLKGAGLSPAVMMGLFEKLGAARGQRTTPSAETRDDPNEPAHPQASPSRLGIAFASHPADRERIEFFRAAAAR